MKHIFRIFFTSLLTLTLFTACNQDDINMPLWVEKNEITVLAHGGTEKIKVNSEYEWVAIASEPWLMISPANGMGSTICDIVIDSTLVNVTRSATIRFTCSQDQSEKIVTVRQSGFDKVIIVEEPEIKIEAMGKTDKRYIETSITTNIPFKVEIEYVGGQSDWLEPKLNDIDLDLDRGARPRTAKMRIDWSMNTVPEERIARVNFFPRNAEDEIKEAATLTITQEAAIKIEDTRAGDSIAMLVIYEKLNMFSTPWNSSERLENWHNVTLWEKTDTNLPCPEAVGRVRSVSYSMFKTKETIPQEIRYLKYLEELYIGTNVNTMLLNIELGNEICELEYLKKLTIFAYGLISLPEEFVKLGNTLEYLDLSTNNFAQIPDVLNKENFPKLKHLIMVANRRWTTTDLRKRGNYEDGLGLDFKVSKRGSNALRNLFLWDTLEELKLSNNYIEGEIPDFTVGVDGVEGYTMEDVEKFGGDTILYAAQNNIPKILPNMKMLALNLNFFTGDIPDWMLYHPYFLEWVPEILMFNQQERGINSEGASAGFNNAPTSFEYYYQAYPLYKEKYEFVEEIEDEEDE